MGVYIYESESIAIRDRNILEYGLEHRKAMCTARETQECLSEHGIGTGPRLGTGTGTGTKLETETLRAVLVIPEFECGTNFQESWELV